MNTSDMTLRDAAKRLWEQKFSFAGRSSRSEYWLSIAVLYIVAYAAFFLLAAVSAVAAALSSTATAETISAAMSGTFVIVACFLSIAFFVAALTLNARRLHDIGKSGWWQLLSLIPVIGGFILFFWFVRPSDQDNQYGPKEI
ncbi:MULTISPECIES: DUF805 domain-containing protein [Megasphaera]|jgi:uncharacterized membrane protein YhaH (DUF805 family)|nr:MULTISPECIES: DUF805 domain-containing protein [Megasphaera]MBM6731321.1 DUF805 domain-containing protein [Megasphaera stantonii]MCU6713815.1 DUF805 domain-containing protein [Megasphaera butyrica]SCH19622.1 Inner membrane protein yhaH [uncultured Megasphaera sp.]SCI89492.1 Inner membrane protein yhaH [uncultured Ruminococcus sp.]